MKHPHVAALDGGAWLVGSALVSVVVLVVVLDAGGGAPQPSPAGLRTRGR